jgi:hypothetical protein
MNAGGLDRPLRVAEDGTMHESLTLAALRYRTIREAATRAREERDEEAMYVAQQALGIAAEALTAEWHGRRTA